MSKFNSTHAPTKTVNLAGGSAYIQDAKNELASMLLTSFLGDGAYRSGTKTMERIADLVASDPLFAAKAAVYARNEFGMRSVSHVVAAEVVQHVKGEQWTKEFIKAVVRRPDDMLEIAAYRDAKYGLHPLPNALKKGFRSVLKGLNEYSLAKYRGEGKKVGMVDLVNLTHPRSTDALTKLMKGDLKSEETWEYVLSHTDNKSGAWDTLIFEGKLGHMALLRNLRNIAQHASDRGMSAALAQLVNEETIKKSLVLPFRYYTAYTMLRDADIDQRRKSMILASLSHAADIAVDNMPDFDGTTLIALDTSGSMTEARVSDKSRSTVAEIGALFACAMAKKLGHKAYVMTFDTQSMSPAINPSDSVLTITQQIVQGMRGGGTNLDLPFDTDTAFDRVIVLSDMQAWTNGEWGARSYWGYAQHRPAGNALENYKQRTGANPHVYALDLTGYGSIQFPKDRCFQFAGWSEKVFDLMALLEGDRGAMVNAIEGVTFT